MKTRLVWLAVAFLSIATTAQAVVVSPPTNASPQEKLAAQELQRYIYLRTGELPQISSQPASQRIVLSKSKSLQPQEYQIRTTRASGRTAWQIVGGDDDGILYGAYRFVEKLGVRFYLHGDVIPDARLSKLPDVNETGKPIFSIRGIQPFHDFPEGPDWWQTDDYLAYISQLPKMRMNFIGFHSYPVIEPAVWHGLRSDMDYRGNVKFSYPTRWANTTMDGAWGYATLPTSEYTSGASLLFTEDKYGHDAMKGMFPYPQTPEQSNELFNNVGEMFRTAFSHARALGVKTCVGTETPLSIPGQIQERLKQQGMDPADPKAVTEIYKGTFRRIARAYPVDYYWLWTNEGWTWGGNSEEDIKAITRDFQCALDALDSIGNPFTLATCGWVLGPVQDRSAFDKALPKESPMSCISREVGHATVEPSFADITGRPKWAIPWMENDPDLTSPQPWVGRMRYDAADAKRLGCTGLLGIHWRTKALCQNVAALAAASWEQSWVPADFASSKTKQDNRIGPLGGRLANYPEPVEGTDDDPVYQTVRWNMEGYRLKVPSGTYTVTLKFNEPCYNDPGKRVFGVKLQGKQVIEHLDMIAKVGKNKALDYTFPDVEVDDVPLKIDFTYEVEYPCIAGIVIESQDKSYIRKINCGGQAYHDYEADTSVKEDEDMRRRTMPVESFYIDFARASFGNEIAVPAGKIMAKIDGMNLPQESHWLDGPGGVPSNTEPWDKMKISYSFVDDFAALRNRIKSPGDLERFDYWLNTYRYTKAMVELSCVRGQLDIRVEAIKAEKDSAKQQELAKEALELRVQMSRLWERMIALQLQAVDTPGEMGTIDNLERHSRKQLQFLSKNDEFLAKLVNSSLPKEVELSKSFDGPARISVPTVRTQVKPGESLTLKVIILDDGQPTNAVLKWRPLGKGEYRQVELKNIGRAVYEAELPPMTGSFEYYITTQTSDGKLVWPATAPKINQTVVVW